MSIVSLGHSSACHRGTTAPEPLPAARRPALIDRRTALSVTAISNAPHPGARLSQRSCSASAHCV